MGATLPRHDARCTVVAPTPSGAPLCVRWTAANSEVFGGILRSWRGEIGCYADVWFDERDRHWWVPACHEAPLRRWLQGTFDEDAVEWEEVPTRWRTPPRHGQAPPPPPPRQERAKAKKKKQAPPPPRRQPALAERDRAYAALWLLPGSPPELVQAAYRVLAKRAHPDVGGSHEAMTALNEAYSILQG